MNNGKFLSLWKEGGFASAGVLTLALTLNAAPSFGARTLNLYLWA